MTLFYGPVCLTFRLFSIIVLDMNKVNQLSQSWFRQPFCLFADGPVAMFKINMTEFSFSFTQETKISVTTAIGQCRGQSKNVCCFDKDINQTPQGFNFFLPIFFFCFLLFYIIYLIFLSFSIFFLCFLPPFLSSHFLTFLLITFLFFSVVIDVSSFSLFLKFFHLFFHSHSLFFSSLVSISYVAHTYPHPFFFSYVTRNV